ncbi:hypothetical protein NMG60_11019458 [Bertholletia excelsa]
MNSNDVPFPNSVTGGKIKPPGLRRGGATCQQEKCRAAHDGHFPVVLQYWNPATDTEAAAVELAGAKFQLHGHEQARIFLPGEGVEPLGPAHMCGVGSGPAVNRSSITYTPPNKVGN